MEVNSVIFWDVTSCSLFLGNAITFKTRFLSSLSGQMFALLIKPRAGKVGAQLTRSHYDNC